LESLEPIFANQAIVRAVNENFGLDERHNEQNRPAEVKEVRTARAQLILLAGVVVLVREQ
jgi:hypothetical protein